MTRIVIMKLHIAPGREREFEDVVAERAKVHGKNAGFERLYLLRSETSGEYRMVSWWKEIPDPEAWVRKEVYALSEDPKHAGLVVGPVPHEAMQIARQF